MAHVRYYPVSDLERLRKTTENSVKSVHFCSSAAAFHYAARTRFVPPLAHTSNRTVDIATKFNIGEFYKI